LSPWSLRERAVRTLGLRAWLLRQGRPDFLPHVLGQALGVLDFEGQNQIAALQHTHPTRPSRPSHPSLTNQSARIYVCVCVCVCVCEECRWMYVCFCLCLGYDYAICTRFEEREREGLRAGGRAGGREEGREGGRERGGGGGGGGKVGERGCVCV
jgi:uncharacterized membrane protein YgcG